MHMAGMLVIVGGIVLLSANIAVVQCVPTNLQADRSPSNCAQVTLHWDPPADNSNAVGHYRVRLDGSGFEQTFTTPTNSFTLTGLSCCTTYQYTVAAFTVAGYGATSPAFTFRTLADLTSSPINVNVQVPSATQIIVSWIVPMAVLLQGVTQYQIALTAQCYNDDESTPSQRQIVGPNDDAMVVFTGLAPFVPYQVRIIAVICQSSVPVYSNVHFTQQANVEPPSITVASRLGQTTARVEFNIPDAEVNADYFNVSYFTNSGSFNPNLRVGSTRTTVSELQINGLHVCSAYYITVTAVNCGTRISSEPTIIDIFRPTTFEITVSLGSGGDCSSWIEDNLDQKLSDMYNLLMSTLRLPPCEISSPCAANGMWMCTNENTKATYMVSLGDNGGTTGNQQHSCLMDWADDVEIISIGGATLQVVSQSPILVLPITLRPTESDINATPEQTVPVTYTGLPTYVWIIIGVVVAVITIAAFAAIVVVAIVVVVVLVVNTKSTSTHQKCNGDKDIAHDTHTNGMHVANPLFSRSVGDDAGHTGTTQSETFPADDGNTKV